ncbi:MAG: hypothetical protein ACK557_03810, partial [Planctomycetota bacterium]
SPLNRLAGGTALPRETFEIELSHGGHAQSTKSGQSRSLGSLHRAGMVAITANRRKASGVALPAGLGDAGSQQTAIHW